MANYNTSSAYNLDTFESPRKKEEQAPDLKIVKNRRQIASAAFTPRVFSAFAIIVTLLSLIIYNRVELTEVTTEIDSLSVKMQELQTEHTKLSSELDSAVSLESIAELAEEMGMQKRGEYQTKRIYLYREDKIERTENTPTATRDNDVKIAVSSLFSNLKEYLPAN